MYILSFARAETDTMASLPLPKKLLRHEQARPPAFFIAWSSAYKKRKAKTQHAWAPS